MSLKRGYNSFRASGSTSTPRPNEDLRLFMEKMNPLFERLPSDGNERRACMKFDKSPGDRFSDTQKEQAQVIIKYARAYSFTAWYGSRPLMTEEDYIQTIKAIVVNNAEAISSSFFDQIMRMEQKTLNRFWYEFKSSQLKFMFSVFSHGGSVILTSKQTKLLKTIHLALIEIFFLKSLPLLAFSWTFVKRELKKEVTMEN